MRRVAVECATRKITEVSSEALDAALSSVLKMKGPPTADMSPPPVARPPPDTSPFVTAEPVFQAPPAFDIKKAVMFDADSGDDEEEDEGPSDEADFAEALEEALVGLGYDADDNKRRELAKMLGDAIDGTAPLPEEIRQRVGRTTGASAEEVDEALKRQAKSALVAVEAAIAWSEKREEQLDELDDGEKEEVLRGRGGSAVVRGHAVIV